MFDRLFSFVSAFVGLALLSSVTIAQPDTAAPPTPSPVAGLPYTVDFFPGSRYDSSIPTPKSLLGFRIGDRAAKHAQIEHAFQVWADASDRTKLVEYARTYENRALYYMVISSPKNIRNLDQIKRDQNKLADPRTLKPGEGEKLVKTMPAVAWLAYSIHGDETSGADAALAVAYQLIASKDKKTTSMLDDLVVIIDPMMNPDGRDRFLQMIAEHRSASPDVDDQSLIHSGYWPAGRGNHYMFDLNRDWIFGVNPESRGRIKAVGQWRPLMLVDIHEMSAQDTYLFSPSRPPINPFLPLIRLKWWDDFAKDQAAAFDQHGWTYYTGEWNEEWYPGYSSSWAGFKGAVGILYEQAGLAEDGVRRPEGRVMAYREAVHHQAVSSMANLSTLQRRRVRMFEQRLIERRDNLKGGPQGANRVYAIPPAANHSRMERLLSLLDIEGVEVYTADRGFVAHGVTDRLGRKVEQRPLPEGTILIPAAQPEAPIVRALLEFDPRMTPEFLTDERRQLLRFGRSKLYDVTAWNLTMMFDLEAYMLDMTLPGATTLFEGSKPTTGSVENPSAKVGFIVDGADDRAPATAARLLERGVQVRVADRATNFDGKPYSRGSVVITRIDNSLFKDDLVEVLGAVCKELGVTAVGFESGLAPGDVADLGGGHFILLNRPRIAILSRGSTQPTDVGSMWFTIDQRLGVRSTMLDIDSIRFADLRRYNVIIVPTTFGKGLNEQSLAKIKTWVQAGGTLIASGSSAGQLAKESSELSEVRRLPDVLDNLDDYRLAVMRQWLGRMDTVDAAAVWSNTPASAPDPWADDDSASPSPDERKRQDQWQSIFMPQGAILAGRTDDKSWLTFGAGHFVPIVFGRNPILMAGSGVSAPVRLGVIAERSTLMKAAESDNDDKSVMTNWAPVPDGHELRLRMSGLLWPEAAQRIANAAYLTVERQGRGQVILFASPPTFRAAALGTTRLFLNAVVYGPGFASSHVIEP